MNLPIFELFVDEESLIGLALVEDPAIEKDFVYFNNEEPTKMVFNDEKMIVKGPAMIPGKLIYRNDKFGERYVYFSEDTIKHFAELLLNKPTEKFNLDHTDNYINANIVESYFTDEPNEFDVPKNSWVIALKIKDKEVWENIKAGTFQGFSIEGYFLNELVEFNTNNNNINKQNQMSEIKEKLLNAINEILFAEPIDPNATPTEPTMPVEEVNPVVEVSDDAVEAMIDAKLAEYKAEVEVRLAALEAKIMESMSAVETKVEEFGNQPLTLPVTEEVTAPKATNKTESKAVKFFK